MLQLSSAFAAATAQGCPARNVFLDLGTNWCNTATIYPDLVRAAGRTPNPGPWEVYGFEASPLIQPYVDACYASRSRGEEPPPICIPRSGSSNDLHAQSRAWGCTGPGHRLRRWRQWMYPCMFRKLRTALHSLYPDPALSKPQLIRERLATHMHRDTRPCTAAPARFTFVPGAVGGSEGTMKLQSAPEQLIRGGAKDTGITKQATSGAQFVSRYYTYRVPVVDVASWISQSFSHADFLVVKIDVEGGEFPFFSKLGALNATHLIDILGMECHNIAGSCGKLVRDVRHRAPNTFLLREGTRGSGVYRSTDVQPLRPARQAALIRGCLAKYPSGEGAPSVEDLRLPEHVRAQQELGNFFPRPGGDQDGHA